MPNNADNNLWTRFVQNQLVSLIAFIFLGGQMYSKVLIVIDKVTEIEDVQSEYRRYIHTLETNQAVIQDDLEELTKENRSLHYPYKHEKHNEN